MVRFFNQKREIIIVLQGGLADQLKRFFAGLYLAKLFETKRITLNVSTLSSYHIGEATAFRSLLTDNTEFSISGGEIFRNKLRLRARGFLSRFASCAVGSRLLPFLLSKIDMALGYVDDLIPGTWETRAFSSMTQHMRKFRFRKRIVVSGYFPSPDYFMSLEHKKRDLLNFEAIRPTNERNKYVALHFRVGDIYTTYKSVGLLNEQYYFDCISEVRKNFPDARMFGISDNVVRAKHLYPNIEIAWIHESELWTADKVLRFLASAPILVQSHSGLAMFAGLLSISPEERGIFAPKILDGKHFRSHRNAVLANRWNFLPAELWYPE